MHELPNKKGVARSDGAEQKGNHTGDCYYVCKTLPLHTPNETKMSCGERERASQQDEERNS